MQMCVLHFQPFRPHDVFARGAYEGIVRYSQPDPNVRTIEGVLFDALIKVGAVSQDNSDNPTKVSRTCATCLTQAHEREEFRSSSAAPHGRTQAYTLRAMLYL